MSFIVYIKSFLILGRSFPYEYTVLSSAKLQIFDFSTKKKMPLMNILNNDGDNIERCSNPQKISDYLLHEEPISKGKLKLPIYNSYISNFAISPAAALSEGKFSQLFQQ